MTGFVAGITWNNHRNKKKRHSNGTWEYYDYEDISDVNRINFDVVVDRYIVPAQDDALWASTDERTLFKNY